MTDLTDTAPAPASSKNTVPHTWQVKFVHEDTMRTLRILAVNATGSQAAIDLAREEFESRCPNYDDCYMIASVHDLGATH